MCVLRESMFAGVITREHTSRENLCPPEMEKSVVTGVENGSVALSCY